MHRITFREPKTRRPVVLVVEDDLSMSVTVDGEPVDLQGERVMAALGGTPPTWFLVAQSLPKILDVCPDAPIREVLDFVALSNARRTAMAKDTSVVGPPWLMWALTFDPLRLVRTSLVKRMPAEAAFEPMLLALVDDSEPEVRRQVLKHGAWSRAVLEKMSQSSVADARRAVGAVKDLPADLVERLAQDREAEVRAVIARREPLPVPLARRLVMDRAPSVREDVVRNESVPAEVWEPLLDDPDLSVADFAWARRYAESPHGAVAQEYAARERRLGRVYGSIRMGLDVSPDEFPEGFFPRP